jgi:hypothetical protein
MILTHVADFLQKIKTYESDESQHLNFPQCDTTSDYATLL